MRVLALLAALGTTLLTLTACGGGDERPVERTVVINPTPSQTVVVPYTGPVVRQCPAGATVC